ncbi:MAG: tetratricopeptide repeat protein, partial [Acidobacteriota bacterium]|nr:tetratricopeptide repeat protein [Acidobacteriota bacterium]
VNYIRLQQYAKAREVVIRELEARPDHLNLTFLRGFLARAEGIYDESITAFEKADKLSPDNADVLANLGFLAFQRGEIEKAEKILRRTLELDPDNFTALYDLGRLLVREKRVNEALPILLRGTEIGKNDPGIFYQLFIAYSRLKQKAKADTAFAEFKRLEEALKPSAGSATSVETNRNLPKLPADPDKEN